MTKSSQAYFSRPSLPFRVTPFPDEGLGELLLRAAAENCYDGMDWILSLADAQGLVVAKIRESSAENLKAIADLLQLEEGQMHRLMHPLVPDRPGMVSFFGTPVRRRYLDQRARRVSPRALKKASYLRACWALRIFSFDFETKETLLDRCPICKKRLSFRNIIQVWSCERCNGFDEEGHIRATVDFRDFPQSLIEVEDEEALNFVTSLVDPKCSSAPRLINHADLAELSRSDLFELVTALCRATICGPNQSKHQLWQPKELESFEKFTPELLALVGRTVLSWPEGFHALASDARNQVRERDGFFGTLKEFGPLAKIATDGELPLTVRNVVKTAIHADIAAPASLMTSRHVDSGNRAGLITRMEALQKLNCSGVQIAKLALHPGIQVVAPASGRGTVLFQQAQIEQLLKRRDEIVSGHAVSLRTGIGFSSLRYLAECGHIERETGAVLALMQGGEFYCKRSIAAFESNIRARGNSEDPPVGYLRLSTGMNNLSKLPDRMWVKVIDSILSGDLPIWHERNHTATLVASICIRDQACLARLCG